MIEAFAWSSSSIFAEAALGNVVAGVVVERAGVREALALTAVAGITGWLVTRHAPRS